MLTKKYSTMTTRCSRITKQMIREGIKLGIIRFDHEPGSDHGTACYIGKYWFRFGGNIAQKLDPEEYLRDVSVSDIVDEIYDALNIFSASADTATEYAYYNTYLRTNL